jgi:hypothetical protein
MKGTRHSEEQIITVQESQIRCTQVSFQSLESTFEQRHRHLLRSSRSCS